MEDEEKVVLFDKFETNLFDNLLLLLRNRLELNQLLLVILLQYSN